MNTKNRIISTTLELFLQHGFYKVSLQMVAKKIGVTKPTIYYYFKNKDHLIENILEQNAEKIKTWNQEHLTNIESPENFLERLFTAIPIYANIEKILLEDNIVNYHSSYNEFLLALSKYKMRFREIISQIKLEFRHNLEHYIRKAQKMGSLRTDLQSSRLALLIQSIIEGTDILCELDPKLNVNLMSEDMFETLWKVIKKN